MTTTQSRATRTSTRRPITRDAPSGHWSRLARSDRVRDGWQSAARRRQHRWEAQHRRAVLGDAIGGTTLQPAVGAPVRTCEPVAQLSGEVLDFAEGAPGQAARLEIAIRSLHQTIRLNIANLELDDTHAQRPTDGANRRAQRR